MKTGTYREDGGKHEVEILDDASNAEVYRYKLKVLSSERQPVIGNDLEVGEVFDVWQKKGVCFGGMWDLTIHAEAAK